MDKFYISTFFIFITNNCNLKCLGCMQSCDRIKEPYYMTKQELIECLKILQKKNFTIQGNPVRTIHLTGGDPLTHPQWKEFCQLIHEYVPNLYIDISTNGLLLNQLSDEELKYLNTEYKITFQLSIYPDINLLKMYKNIMQRFKKLNIFFTFDGESHFFFSKQDKTGNILKQSRDYSQNCKQILDNQTHVIFYKGKIYSCWKDINILQRENHLNDDGYILNDDTPTELIQNKKHYYCDVCKYNNSSGGEEFILWQHHSKNAEEVFNSNLKELFIYNYPLYYSLQHDCKKKLDVVHDELFQKFLSQNQKHYVNTRFLNGKGDIFIPFSKEIPFDEKFLFLNNMKDINQYNIYLISINNSQEVEDKAYNAFLPFNKGSQLNVYLLKASSLYNAYKTFLDNSYLSNKFIIDIEQNNFELLPLQN